MPKGRGDIDLAGRCVGGKGGKACGGRGGGGPLILARVGRGMPGRRGGGGGMRNPGLVFFTPSS